MKGEGGKLRETNRERSEERRGWEREGRGVNRNEEDT